MTLALGPLRLRSPWILAPMEAVSDCAFRKLCYSLGASFTWTEMVRASSFLRQNPSTLALVDTYDSEVPTGLQLLTKGPDELQKALETLFELRSRPEYGHFRNIRAIDLNFGCPNPELIEKGQGPAMVKRTRRIESIFTTLKETVRAHDTSIAVGAKIRLGLNEREMRYKVAIRLVSAANSSLDYLIVHGKHAGQRGLDQADWAALKEFKEALTIPFIANGGALDAAKARELSAFTKADGVLIARGAIQNPWIFRALTGRGAELPSAAEIDAAWQRYLEDAKRFGTKRKYLEFHEENFTRMRKDFSGKENF